MAVYPLDDVPDHQVTAWSLNEWFSNAEEMRTTDDLCDSLKITKK